MNRIPVAVLGATGTVGQKFIALLENHPWFTVAAVAASEQSVGKRYGDVARWRETTEIPKAVADLVVQPCEPTFNTPIVFSALDNTAAGPIEAAFAAAGAMVVTNAGTYRMDPVVPLIIPEVNPDHLGLLSAQRAAKGWTGGIITNPNCTTAGLVVALTPLHRAFGIDRLFVSTMQAASGAGWPGVASLDIVGNVIPFINNEEEKVERETCKLLGTFAGESVAPATIKISAHTNRVPVIDGHTETVSVGLNRRVDVAEATATLETWKPDSVVAGLPSSPDRVIEVDQRPDRPQPRLDLERGGGMTVIVGRLRPCPILDLRFVCLSHNRIRGAAGAAIQNGELLVAKGLVSR